MKAKTLYAFVGFLGFLFLFQGCGTSSKEAVKPNVPEQPAEQMPEVKTLEKVEKPSLFFGQDDLSKESLARAIQSSLRYLNRISPEEKFDYGGTVYTAEEIKESMALFLELLSLWDNRTRFESELKQRFDFYQSPGNEDGQVLFTAYFEPVLEASSVRTERHIHPAYAVPSDLNVLDLGAFRPNLANKTIVFRKDGENILPYYDRREIMDGKALEGKAEALAWFANPLDLFFLQIQGSGIVKLEDGNLQRLGYAGANGREYFSIGRMLVREEKIPLEKISMQSIRAYLESNPHEIERVMYSNPSYTFFQIQTMEEGPFGNINVPLTPERSLATDYQLFPKGGLAFIETEIVVCAENASCDQKRPVKRFMVNQDTGGAIRGFGRADIFMGRGDQAGARAGKQKSTGKVWFLVAKKEYLRLAPNTYSFLTMEERHGF